jgi:hypothetical protein
MTKDEKLQVYSELVERQKWLIRLGQAYNGSRDIYEALGYPEEIKYEDYYSLFRRQDIANAIITRPVQKTWSGKLELMENKELDKTEFEQAWIDLEKRLKLKSKLIRLDKLSGIGRFAILLLGFDDVKQSGETANPVTGSPKLIYARPFGEGDVTISKYVQDPGNPRYGMPELYTIRVSTTRTGGAENSSLTVHHSRVLHVVNSPLEDEVFGTPMLEKVYNRLKDLEKLTGGSAEMFWRGARPGYQGKVDGENYELGDAEIEKFKTQLNEYEHNLRRFIMQEGITMEELASQVSSPTEHVNVQIQMISAATGIPQRILTGSERGELSSSQDKSAWLEVIQDRRQEYASPEIIQKLVDRLMQYGVLPKVTKWEVLWSDLFAQSEKEKAEIGKTRADALKSYSQYGFSSMIMPPEQFFKIILGLSDEEVEAIQEAEQNELVQEQEGTEGMPDENFEEE